MPTIRTTISDPSLIAARRLPRNDVLVAEEEVAPGVFRGVAGPFSTWEREIHNIDGETVGQTVLVETLRARLAAPHLGRLMELLLRHPIRHGVPATPRRGGHRPNASPNAMPPFSDSARPCR